MREILKLELKKLYTMPMVYVLALMCILFNIFLFWDGVGYFLEGIHSDVKMLKTDKEQFVNICIGIFRKIIPFFIIKLS